LRLFREAFQPAGSVCSGLLNTLDSQISGFSGNTASIKTKKILPKAKAVSLDCFSYFYKKFGNDEFANFRKNCVLMCSGFNGASKFRDKLSIAKDFESIKSIFSLIE